jgi:hypothetical protein
MRVNDRVVLEAVRGQAATSVALLQQVRVVLYSRLSPVVDNTVALSGFSRAVAAWGERIVADVADIEDWTERRCAATNREHTGRRIPRRRHTHLYDTSEPVPTLR